MTVLCVGPFQVLAQDEKKNLYMNKVNNATDTGDLLT